MKDRSFQSIILKLQEFWGNYGCAILQPYDLEVGAGTFHPATVLRCLSDEEWKVAYVQPSRRPTDSRFGAHPNRMQHYYQFQVILKPSPDDIQDLYIESLECIGIDTKLNDIRFVEDDWASPTLAASGLGWEVWCNGMEVSQFTYMQQIGGIECRPVPGEITYGLERLAMYVQDVNDYKDLAWNYGEHKLYKYADIDLEAEKQFSEYNLHQANVELIKRYFIDCESECNRLMSLGLTFVAYDFCLKASHYFNLLNSRGILSVTERAHYINRVRTLAKICCQSLVSNRA